MKKIQDYNLHNANNGEHHLFHYDVLAILTPTVATTYKVEGLREAYAALFETENDLYMINRTLSETELIEDLDHKRDELFLYIKQIIEANLISPFSEKKKAAKGLALLLNPYRDAYRQPYAVNTSQVRGLLDDFMTDSSREMFRSFDDLADVVEMLKKANEEFGEIYGSRSEAKHTRNETETLKSIRPKVDDAFEAIASAINSTYEFNNLVQKDADVEKSLVEIIHRINSRIAQLKETLALRKAKTKMEEEEETK
jgi:hypothetical protein